MKVTSSKNLKPYYFVIISLNLTLMFAIAYIHIVEYCIRYPQFKMEGLECYIYLFLIFLIPSILSIIKIASRSETTNSKTHLFLIGTSLFFSILSGFIFLLMPPIQSYTDDIKNYLLEDKDLTSYAKFYEEFFPQKIPTDAQNISYSYKKSSDCFDTDATIFASWTLPEQSYLNYKQEMLEKSELKYIKGDTYEVSLHNVYLPEHLQLFFEYDDYSCELKYSAIIQRH